MYSENGILYRGGMKPALRIAWTEYLILTSGARISLFRNSPKGICFKVSKRSKNLNSYYVPAKELEET